MLTQVWLLFRIRAFDDSEASILRAPLQPLQNEIAELRGGFENLLGLGASPVEVSKKGANSPAEPLLAQLTRAGEAAEWVGAAIENFAGTMRRRLPRRRPAGIARATKAYRHSDGTFTSGTFTSEGDREALITESAADECEHYAAGGRIRARTACRLPDGTFAPTHSFALGPESADGC